MIIWPRTQYIHLYDRMVTWSCDNMHSYSCDRVILESHDDMVIWEWLYLFFPITLQAKLCVKCPTSIAILETYTPLTLVQLIDEQAFVVIYDHIIVRPYVQMNTWLTWSQNTPWQFFLTIGSCVWQVVQNHLSPTGSCGPIALQIHWLTIPRQWG